MMSLHALTNHMSGTPEIDYPKPERLISGNPKRETCEPGHWRIAFGPDEHELMTVLKGRCRVHSNEGGFVEAGPGEAISLPAGFSGSFEVLEAVTKTYAIVDRQV
jgi:uncharacterized protein